MCFCVHTYFQGELFDFHKQTKKSLMKPNSKLQLSKEVPVPFGIFWFQPLVVWVSDLRALLVALTKVKAGDNCTPEVWGVPNLSSTLVDAANSSRTW